MTAARLLAENVSALLVRHHLKQTDLAKWCRKSDPWVSQFLRGKRNWQLADLDRVADLFGKKTYELFIPGVAMTTERRVSDRRSGRERRIGHAQRQAGRLAEAIDVARPRGSHVAPARLPDSPTVREIHRLVLDFNRRLGALVAQADVGGQDSRAGVDQSKARRRARAVGGSDAPND